LKAETPDWIGGRVADLRRWRDAQPEVVAPVLPGDVTLRGLPPADGGGIECIPDGPVRGAVLHFHGGGFFVGSPYTHRCVGAWLAHALRRTVWLCPWPLAPEHVLPRQSDAAVGRLRQAGARYGTDIVLSGDSAGAMMALWAWAFASTASRDLVRSVLLLYGFFGAPSETEDESGGLGKRSVSAMMHRLDPKGLMRSTPAFTPLAPGFPMAKRVVAVGAESDPLLDNTIALASRHPHVRTMIAARCGHGFLSTVQPSRDALRALAQAAALV